MENAKMAIIALGSAAGTIKSAIENLDEVGLIRIRMFRPFPKEELRKALEGVEKVAVIERNMQSIVTQEVNNVVRGPDYPQVVSFPAGLGGRDINPQKVLEIIERLKKESGQINEPIWIDLKKKEGGDVFSQEKYFAVAVKIPASKENILKEIPDEE